MSATKDPVVSPRQRQQNQVAHFVVVYYQHVILVLVLSAKRYRRWPQDKTNAQLENDRLVSINMVRKNSEKRNKLFYSPPAHLHHRTNTSSKPDCIGVIA
jgi:hypothetical protein